MNKYKVRVINRITHKLIRHVIVDAVSATIAMQDVAVTISNHEFIESAVKVVK